jgi:hypothetical protein
MPIRSAPSLMLSLTLPSGIPMPQWAGFPRPAAGAAAADLRRGEPQRQPERDGATVSGAVLARLSLPALVAPHLMASLTAALNAIAPLQLGLAAVQLRVSLRLSALLATLSAWFGLSLSGGCNLLAALLALLPNLPSVPTSFATTSAPLGDTAKP